MSDYVDSSKHGISEDTLSLSLETRHERPGTRATLWALSIQMSTLKIKPNPASHYVTPARELSN